MAASRMAETTHSTRLTPDEQAELLRHTVEARRIKNIQSSLALRSPSLKPSVSQVAKESGYGDDTYELEASLDRGLQARETIITRNMGLVHFCVNDIIGTRKQSNRLQSLSREDLVQEGAIGLARAIDRWNPEIGGRFSTYAVYWIRAAILRCIAERDDLMRVPEHMSAAVRKMSKAASQLGIDIDGENLLSNVYGTNASWKEAHAAKLLAEQAGLTDKQLMEAIKVRERRRSGMLSFESWMQQGRDFSTDLNSVSEEETSSSLDTHRVKTTLSRFLRPREIEAISWRYGLNDESTSHIAKQKNYLADAEGELFGSTDMPVRGKGGEAMSFSEVAKKMSVSTEYGRRLCHAALEKLRRAAEEGMLEPALLF